MGVYVHTYLNYHTGFYVWILQKRLTQDAPAMKEGFLFTELHETTKGVFTLSDFQPVIQKKLRYCLVLCLWKTHRMGYRAILCIFHRHNVNRKIGPWDLCWFKRWNIEKGNFSLIADICPECWTFIPIGIHCHLVPIGKHCTHMCPECWTSSSHFGEQ